ncbi:MAG TPA: amidohydrolase family protein [Acidimicrobiales bacterium]|jgi:predicted TIM-barrel fold metal-dependent hydrolase|nr:amidohydrolase family protein [Acidimicrobiales bacterium]
MTYAGGRTILDADSHVMELADFLDAYLGPEDAARMKRGTMEALAPVLDEAVQRAERRRSDPDEAAEAESRLLLDKGWFAMGGFEAAERSRVLDLLGFDGQLVFATFASTLYLGRDLGRLYAGATAQNHAVQAFCAGDPRLLGVGYVPLNDPARALETLEVALGLGCAAVMVPSTAAGERSPTHPDLDGFWGTLEAAGVPFVLHVGGGGRLLDPAFHENGRPVTDHLGGGENVRSKDYLAIHHSPEVFLGALVLDGLFDRFPQLRGGCIEQGASWVVSWLRHLDHAQRAFRRTEPPLQALADRPSAYVHRHLKFTPFPGEPVGWMMEQAGADLFMFSTDYPHPEGGRDPLASFEEHLGGVDEADKDRFYRANMAALLHGEHAEAAAAGV